MRSSNDATRERQVESLYLRQPLAGALTYSQIAGRHHLLPALAAQFSSIIRSFTFFR